MFFVWKGAAPRISKHTLKLPLTLGGLTLPCFIIYYWVVILVTLRWWLSEELANPASTLKVVLLGLYSQQHNLIY